MSNAPPPLPLPAWKRRRRFFRIAAVACAGGAAAIAGGVVLESRSFDDGGPPMGACLLALPAFVLLILAGTLWTKASRR